MSDQTRMTLLHSSTNNLVEELLMWKSLAAEHSDRIAEISQAVGLITTLKPTMVMDADHPLDMAKEVVEYATARIAELEAERRWIPVSERLPEKDGYYLVSDDWDGVLSCEFLSSRGEPIWEVPGVLYWMPLPEPPEVEK